MGRAKDDLAELVSFVRIEDIVTVTADGGRRLNNTDRALRVVA